MYKRFLYLGGAVLLLIVGYMFWKGEQHQEAREVVPEMEQIRGSLKDLLAKERPLKCEWSTKDEMGGEGVVYVSGQRMKTEMKIQLEGQREMDIFSLADGGWMYQWSLLMDKGSKFSLSNLGQMGEDGEGTLAEAGSYNQEFEYRCRPWVVDESVFVLPEIEFEDVGEQLETAQQQTEEAKSEVCEICESLEGELGEECLKSCL